MLDLTQLLRTPYVDPLFDISPDNSKIAFAWNKTGEWQIYEMELNDSSQIHPITSGGGGKFNPRYSPDGTKIAYVLDSDGSESYHLAVYGPSTNTHTDLTPNIFHALQPNFCWSPYGNQLAFLSDEQGHFSTYIMSVNGDDKKLVLDTVHPAWQAEWSPDGKHLAVSCEMHGQDYGIFILGLETNETTELPLNAHEPKWSPNGSQLIFHSDEHGWFDIGIYDLSLKGIEWITKNEGDSQAPIIEGNIIAYLQSEGAVNCIEICHAEGRSLPRSISDATGKTLWSHTLRLRGDNHAPPLPFGQDVNAMLPQSNKKIYKVGKGIHNGIKLTSDLKRIVTTFSSPSHPPDLWMINIESGESVQLTNSMPEELSSEEFFMPEEIGYEGLDRVKVPALLFRPKQTPAPAVVMIHGGPNWHYSAEWNPIMAHLASRGYVVLCPNYRGSTGYGREWQYAAQFDMGGVDTRDVAAGAQYLLREELANKIAVTGRSHGGYLTMTCLTQFPESWVAGSAVVPFTNWFKSHDNSREDLQHWNIENMGDPKENYERWYNASPYFFLDKIHAPVQMICGGNDPRCPASDSIETRDKLLELGKDVELLLYEDEGHSFLKIKNVLESETKRVEFLAGALGN